MADHKYSIGRPTQEVRLRNWKGGQSAQFKKAIDFLESELNSAMSAQVAQGAKRVISSRIPKVTGLSVVAGFKSFQITFNEARGISNLLFYEIEKSATANFASATTFTTPQTTLTIPTTTEREQVYIRVRILDSKFQAGPWSSTASATGSSNFRIDSTRLSRTTANVTTFDSWVDIVSTSLQPAVSALSISIQPGAFAQPFDDVLTSPAVASYHATVAASLTYRILRNGVELTTAGRVTVAVTGTYVNDGGEAGTAEIRDAQALFGSMVTPLESFVENETVIYTLQYYADSTLNYKTVNDVPTSITAGELVAVVDAFDILEIIQST